MKEKNKDWIKAYINIQQYLQGGGPKISRGRKKVRFIVNTQSAMKK